jgi:mono/diheme cytochrome c family protein
MLGLILLSTTIILAACDGGRQSAGTQPSLLSVPAEYAGRTNPFTGNAQAIASGRETYAANCLSCHGETGKGDGPVGEALEPKPANLTDPALDAQRSDSTMIWRVSEGFPGTSMPSWKTVLNEEQIWQVIAYIRTLAGR